MRGSGLLRRFATVGAAAAVVVGVSPFLGAGIANAAVSTPNPQGAIDVITPFSSSVIVTTISNGTDSLNTLYADVLQAQTGSGNPLIQQVEFQYKDTTLGQTTPTTI